MEGSVEAVLEGVRIDPWNSTEWWKVVHRKGQWYKGVHPVRYNNKCMDLSLDLATSPPNLKSWWHPGWVPPGTSSVDEERAGDAMVIHPTAFMNVGGFPYFTNTIWLTSTTLYTRTLHSIHLVWDAYDEVTMNRYIINENKLPFCVLEGHGVLHMAYNSNPKKAAMVTAAADSVRDKLKEWGRHQRFDDSAAAAPARSLTTPQPHPVVATAPSPSTRM